MACAIHMDPKATEEMNQDKKAPAKDAPKASKPPTPRAHVAAEKVGKLSNEELVTMCEAIAKLRWGRSHLTIIAEICAQEVARLDKPSTPELPLGSGGAEES